MMSSRLNELTRRFGTFYGIRIDGRLAAMAGVRMRPAEHLHEVSGVCTWPEYRGQGLAAHARGARQAGSRSRMKKTQTRGCRAWVKRVLPRLPQPAGTELTRSGTGSVPVHLGYAEFD